VLKIRSLRCGQHCTNTTYSVELSEDSLRYSNKIESAGSGKFTEFRMFVLSGPFVKRFALCYRTVVCLSVTLVYCGQTVGWGKGAQQPQLFVPRLWPNGRPSLSQQLMSSCIKVSQVFSSSCDGRPFGHNRYGPQRRGVLCPFRWGS